MTTRIRHHKIGGRCYIYEVEEKYLGPCEEHSPPQRSKGDKGQVGGRK